MLTVLENSLFILTILIILANALCHSKIIRVISILLLGYYITFVIAQPIDMPMGAFIISLFLLFTYLIYKLFR